LACQEGGELLDEVVAIFFPGPNSPTGEDLLEVTAHGSPYILDRLLAAALEAGARLAQPGEFTQRAFINGCLDLAQAEAVSALIRARTGRAHRSALVQLQGGLSRRVGAIRESLFGLLVRLEVTLDHPEEDLPSLQQKEALVPIEQALSEIRALSQSFDRGRRIFEGSRICIAGRPNAGKSSLLNLLLGRERAIVCREPGTTRDTLEEPSDLAGIPTLLIDTAGLRENASDSAELSGMERSRQALGTSDLTVLVIDGSHPLTKEDERIHQTILEQAREAARPVIIVLNKSDLPQLCPTQADAVISALCGNGIERLIALIAEKLKATPEDSDGLVVSSLRHYEALAATTSELEEARRLILAMDNWEDRAAFNLRQALQGLGEIIGEGAPDEVLKGVFSRFCIGK
jgi:tRNA modification GTPase